MVSRTRTRNDLNPNDREADPDTEADAAGRSVRVCDARNFKSQIRSAG